MKMNHKKTLALIFILAIIFRLIFAFVIPIFEKPDEESHFRYIEFLIENKRLPVQQEGNYGAEFFQPPFYHIIASFILSFVKIFTKDIWYQILSMRILSIIVSMFTLFLVYKIASLIFSNRNLVLGIVVFASFLPSHINMNSAITNANFGDFLTTLIIYIFLKFQTIEKNDIFLLGLVAGIALITRLSLIPVILTIPFALIVKYYPKIQKNIKIIIKHLVIIGVIALIISSWNLFRNFSLYGDFLGINAMQLASPPDDIQVDTIFVARLSGWTFITFWASFGKTNGVFIGNLTSVTGIAIFIVSYLLLLLITLASLYGLYHFLKKYRKNKNILSNMQKKAFVIIAFHLTLLSLSFISFNLYDFQPQGRLFFPAISTIAILFTFGIYNLFNWYNKNKLFNIYFISFILLNIISIISVTHFYLL